MFGTFFYVLGIAIDVFHCFGIPDNGIEQLKISDRGNINAETLCLIKYGGIFQVFEQFYLLSG